MICHNCIQRNGAIILRVCDLYSETKWSVKMCLHLSLLRGPGLWGGDRELQMWSRLKLFIVLEKKKD